MKIAACFVAAFTLAVCHRGSGQRLSDDDVIQQAKAFCEAKSLPRGADALNEF
jgi:hypothetical protein